MATRSVFVLATVLSIRDTFFYPSCTRCHKKVHARDGEANILWCEGCHEEYSAESVEYRYRISVVASDRTQLAQITVFGSCLDRFFGTSATNFARFVNDQNFDPLPIAWRHLLNQAVERCFVGSSLQFGFRVYSPRRTNSQIARNSPFHLKNIVKKQGASENKSCQPEGLPRLLACQIFPCSSSDQQNPTVLQILNEYLQELQRNTPQSLSLRISQGQSQHSPLIDHSQTQASYKNKGFATSCGSLQGNKPSPMCCTPQEFCSIITPLVLTGSSQPSSGTIQMHENPPGFRKLEHLQLGLKDYSSHVSSQNKDINNNSNSLRLTQFTTPAGVRVFKKLDDCKELQAASDEWTEYDDLPSSEDLSAFLADLEMDAVNKENGQTLPNLFTTPAGVRVFKKLDDSKELQAASYEWTEYDDLPSSEDLSAFLADLEMNAVNKEGEQTLPNLCYEKCCSHQPSVTSDEMTSGKVTSDEVTSQVMTSQITSLNDVICRLTQTSFKEDYTEFTDLPSSEDLDAFLADMELHCENIPMGKSLLSTATMGSDDDFRRKLFHKAEECRTLKSNEYRVQNIVDTDHTKQAKNILNLSKLYEDNVDKEEAICDIKLSSDCFCGLEDSVRSSCNAKITSISDKMVHDIESSDSQFLRDCESVFTEFTEDVCNEKDRIENSVGIPYLAHLRNELVLNDQQRSTHCREDSTKQRKNFCRSGSTDELHEDHIVCDMSLEHEEANIILSHDRDTKKTEVQQGGQITCKGWTPVNHHGHKDVPGGEISNNGFEMMASPDLFSQSLSLVEEVCSESPNLFSSPRLINGESRRSRCTKHLMRTPDLFSYSRSLCRHTHSCSRQEMNSVSLFSCSDHSHLFSSAPLSSSAQPTSLPTSNESEADTQPIVNHREVENEFVWNSQTVSFHSTPYRVNLSSKRLHKIWTPAGVSPLLSDFKGTSPCYEDISVQGSPILFSPISSNSL